MRSRNAVDAESGAAAFREMEEAANVIVLIVRRKEPRGFGRRELKRRQRHWAAELAGECEIQVNQLAKSHTNRSASRFGAHSWLRTQCTASHSPIKEIRRSAGLQPGIFLSLLCDRRALRSLCVKSLSPNQPPSPVPNYEETIWSAAALLPLFPMTRATPFFGETQQFVAELVDW
jgi:hypothetical protein